MFYNGYYFLGMHLIWWFIWLIMLLWILALPYNIPAKWIKKSSFIYAFWNWLNTEKTIPPDSLKRIGIAADHAGFELKNYLVKMLVESGYEVTDYGNSELEPTDDYPDYVIPMARAVASGAMSRGIAVCGSGVGACIVANKVPGVRACLIHEKFSARQGVEDDNMNVICLGGKVVHNAFAWKLISIFLAAKFSGLERHVRRLSEVTKFENSQK